MSRKSSIPIRINNFGPNRPLKTRSQDKSDRKLIDQLAKKVVSKMVDSFDSMSSLMNAEVISYYRGNKVPKAQQTVNIDTLRKNIERKLKKSNMNHGNSNLTSAEELRLVGYLRAFDVNGTPLTKAQTISFVRELHFKANPGWNSSNWWNSFTKKYKSEIVLKNTKQSGKSRLGAEKFVEIENWIEVVQEYVKKYNFSSPYVFNVDETRTEPREHTSGRMVCTEREGRVSYNRPSDLRTTFNVISADGKVWFSLYIYTEGGTSDPDKSGQIPIYHEQRILRSSWPVFYAKTKKGFMTQELFLLALHRLVDMVDVQRADTPIVIFADRPNCHNSMQVIKELFDRDAHIIWFPANTSHVLQPLDGSPFATFKSKLKKNRDDETLSRAIQGKSQNQIVAEISPRTEREAFKPGVIISGFRDRGIWPFNGALILELAKKEFLRHPPKENSPEAREAEIVLSLLINKSKNKTTDNNKIKKVSGIPNANEKLIEHDENREKVKQKAKEEKEAKKKAKEKEKEDKKRKSEESKKAQGARKKAKLQDNDGKRREKESQDENSRRERIREEIFSLDHTKVTGKRVKNTVDYGTLAAAGVKKVKS